ncbi:MAG: hypothetical protein Q9227_004829 [Pyrenula ochraceoflavens]
MNTASLPPSLIAIFEKLLSSKYAIEELQEACNKGSADDNLSNSATLQQKLASEHATYRAYQGDFEEQLGQLLAVARLLDPDSHKEAAKAAIKSMLQVNDQPMLESEKSYQSRQSRTDKPSLEMSKEALGQALQAKFDKYLEIENESEALETTEYCDKAWNFFCSETEKKRGPLDDDVLWSEFEKEYQNTKEVVEAERKKLKKEFYDLYRQAAASGISTFDYVMNMPQSLLVAEESELQRDDQVSLSSGYDGPDVQQRRQFGDESLTPAEDWDRRKNRIHGWANELPHSPRPLPNGYLELSEMRTDADPDDERDYMQPEDNVIDRDIVWPQAGLVFGNFSRQPPRSMEEVLQGFREDAIRIPPGWKYALENLHRQEQHPAVVGTRDEPESQDSNEAQMGAASLSAFEGNKF